MSKVQVFYDGSCHLCSREIDHYRRRDQSHKLDFVDISAAGFDAAKFGLDADKVKQHLHAQDKNGQVKTGVDSFVLIWQELGIFQPMVFLATTAPFRQALKIGYSAFAVLRPLLPKKKCDENGCAKP